MRDQALRQLLIPLLSVGAGIGLLALVIYWIRIWLHENDDSAGSAHELLTEYSEMKRRGELTDEEYRIIKSRMAPLIGRTTSEPRAARSKSPLERLLARDLVPSDRQGPEAESEPAPPTKADEGQAEQTLPPA